MTHPIVGIPLCAILVGVVALGLLLLYFFTGGFLEVRPDAQSPVWAWPIYGLLQVFLFPASVVAGVTGSHVGEFIVGGWVLCALVWGSAVFAVLRGVGRTAWR
jgi:hypothetical protein